jgi:hypothetical protein
LKIDPDHFQSMKLLADREWVVRIAELAVRGLFFYPS